MHTSDFLTPADTGDSLSYQMAGLYLLMRTALLRVIGALTRKRRQLSKRPQALWAHSMAPASNQVESQTSLDEVHSLTAGQSNRLTAGIVTVLASVMLVLPILVLYLVHSMAIKVGLVFVFTVLMAAVTTFGLYMNADRVLAITTA